MKSIIIFGTGQSAELAHFYFTHDSAYDVAAFVLDGAYVTSDAFCGKPVIAFEEVAGRFTPEQFGMFVSIGYKRMNALRRDKVAAARAQGYRLASYLSSKASVFPGFVLRDNCFILEDNTIQPFVQIGENVTLWSGNHIGHHSVIEDDVFITSHVVVSGGCRIGKGSFIGVNSTIRDRVQVGERCMLGAGTILLTDAPDESVFSPGGTERSRVPSSRLRGI